MKKIVVSVVLIMFLSLLFPMSHTDSCECETCWAELERVKHMYE